MDPPRFALGSPACKTGVLLLDDDPNKKARCRAGHRACVFPKASRPSVNSAAGANRTWPPNRGSAVRARVRVDNSAVQKTWSPQRNRVTNRRVTSFWTAAATQRFAGEAKKRLTGHLAQAVDHVVDAFAASAVPRRANSRRLRRKPSLGSRFRRGLRRSERNRFRRSPAPGGWRRWRGSAPGRGRSRESMSGIGRPSLDMALQSRCSRQWGEPTISISRTPSAA